MCGRAYSTYTDEELLFAYLTRDFVRRGPRFDKPNYNFSPTQAGPVVRVIEGNRDLDAMRWGLVPEWAPEFSTKFSTINAKSETVFESRLYKKAILQRRCIVPVSGFIEWKKEGDKKRPFKIFQRERPIMSLAGIWTAWRAGTAEEQRSFSILTTAANKFMSQIHDRMPLILESSQFEEWLDPEVHEIEQVDAMMKPRPSAWLETALDCAEVSTLVNSPRNNRAEVLEPIESFLPPPIITS